mgnify:CR=1 FL=1|tara:strand:- start:5292 stop:5540 length:249 start_codon:yes stop_codon:yes gene_type:complete
MICLNFGAPQQVDYGSTHVVKSDLMMFDYRRYDHIVILNAHTYPNLALFIKLCKTRNIGVTVYGEFNEYTREALSHADRVMV